MNSELKHAEDDCGMTGKVAPHLGENFTGDFKVFQHDLIHVFVANVHRPRLLVNQLDRETSLSIVIELELAVLEDIVVVPHVVDLLNDPVLLHCRELNGARYSSFLTNIACATASLQN